VGRALKALNRIISGLRPLAWHVGQQVWKAKGGKTMEGRRVLGEPYILT
jgi:hypothetical protein